MAARPAMKPPKMYALFPGTDSQTVRHARHPAAQGAACHDGNRRSGCPQPLPLPIPVRIKTVALQPAIDLLRVLGVVLREAADVAAHRGELSGELVASRHTRSAALAGRSCRYVVRHRRGFLEDRVYVRAFDLGAIAELQG